MAGKTKVDPKRIAHKQSFEWQGVIMPNGKTAGEMYGSQSGKTTGAKSPKKSTKK